MYRKYQQKIWRAREIKITDRSSISYKYKLVKKLIEIEGKKSSINWIKDEYKKSISSRGNKKASPGSFVIELIDEPSNQFFLVVPTFNKNKVIKLLYVNVSKRIIKYDIK